MQYRHKPDGPRQMQHSNSADCSCRATMCNRSGKLQQLSHEMFQQLGVSSESIYFISVQTSVVLVKWTSLASRHSPVLPANGHKSKTNLHNIAYLTVVQCSVQKVGL